MKQFTILWVQHASEFVLFGPLAKDLETKGFRSIFVCKTLHAHEAYSKSGFESNFITRIFEEKGVVSRERVRELDERYGPPGIRDIYQSDVHLWHLFKKREQAEELIARAYAFWEDFFDRNRIDFIIERETATFATRTAYTVARRRGIPVFQLTIGPGDTYFQLYDVEEAHLWQDLLDAARKGSRSLSEKEKKDAYEFIRERLPASGKKMVLRFVPPSFTKTFREWVSLWRSDTSLEIKKDPIRVAALRYGRFRLMKQLKWKYLTQPFFRYDMPKENEDFVYFPLYSGLETSYLVREPYWARHELSLIEEIAKSLPVGMFVYVKEHPHNPGDFTFSELRSLQKNSAIRVLHPSISSQYLIEKSKAVVVVGGTAGWEAFLSKKAVIALGDMPFYAQSSLVYKTPNIREFRSVLRGVLHKGDEIYKERADEWLWFIYMIISTCGRGELVKLSPPYGFNADPENVKRVAAYIEQKLTSFGKRATY